MKNESLQLSSNLLEFDVIAADVDWQQETLAAATSVLNGVGSTENSKRTALRLLRFLDKQFDNFLLMEDDSIASLVWRGSARPSLGCPRIGATDERAGYGADELNFLSCSNLAREKKRFRISAFTAKLERAKVFVPRSVGYSWLRLYPNSQSVEILQTDFAVMHTLYQMGTNRRRQV
jgi:hypothetical protein